MKSNRRISRETAFQLLFEWSFHGDSPDDMILHAQQCRNLEADDFALELVDRAIKHVEELDALIESYSQTWKVSRLSKATLAVLRLAFCEITQMEGIPLGATINEAVELCKQFATEDEASYVNGILGQYGRDQGKGTAEPEEEAEAVLTTKEEKAEPPDGEEPK